MQFIPTRLQGAYVIEPKVYGDARGFFCETWRQDIFEAHIPGIRFVQDNESASVQGVLRGLHFQAGDASQAKLVRVTQGTVLDVAVDLRRSSPTFMQHIAVTLSDANHRQLFVPRGMAHGFLVLSPKARFQYKVDNPYAPASEVTLRFDDPAIGVGWPAPDVPLILSDKDLAGLRFEELEARGLLFD